jgi:hypothetical protein
MQDTLSPLPDWKDDVLVDLALSWFEDVIFAGHNMFYQSIKRATFTTGTRSIEKGNNQHS